MPSIERVTVVVPVVERGDDVVSLHQRYREALQQTGATLEYVYVFAPYYSHLAEALESATAEEKAVSTIVLNRNFGEATALQIGVSHAKTPYILTLPAYEQVEMGELSKVFSTAEEDGDADIITVKRWPRVDSEVNQMQARLFHGVLSRFANAPIGDAGSGVRLVKREVFDEVDLYGDMHRFIPTLAFQNGFQVRVVECRQSKADAYKRIYSPRTYLGRLLDILTIVFLTKFNKKPLRFFGSVGAASAAIGGLGLLFLVIDRLFFGVAMSERPGLVLFSLLVVLGVQLIAIGLVGETFIFTHAKDVKEYKIKKIIN